MGRSFPAFQMSFELSLNPNHLPRASLVAKLAQLVKNLPAMRETWVQSLGWEDRLEKGKATTPVFWPGEFHGLYKLDTTGRLSLHFTRIPIRIATVEDSGRTARARMQGTEARTRKSDTRTQWEVTTFD